MDLLAWQQLQQVSEMLKGRDSAANDELLL